MSILCTNSNDPACGSGTRIAIYKRRSIAFAQVIRTRMNDNGTANDAQWSFECHEIISYVENRYTVSIRLNISEVACVSLIYGSLETSMRGVEGIPMFSCRRAAICEVPILVDMEPSQCIRSEALDTPLHMNWLGAVLVACALGEYDSSSYYRWSF